MANQKQFQEAESKGVTILICEHQSQLHGHVACFLGIYHAQRVACLQDNRVEAMKRTPLKLKDWIS